MDGKIAAVAKAFDLFLFPPPAQRMQQQLLEKEQPVSHSSILALC